MEKEMSEKIENLRWAVLEKGQGTRDRMKVSSDVVIEAPEGILQLQMFRDFQKGYKFYDALAMWLGQSQFWNDLENGYLISLAETYLNESDCNGMKLNKDTLLSFGNVNPQKLTNECLMVQMLGLEYCNRCEAKNTRDCGGKNIRKTGKNKAGYKVPLLWEVRKCKLFLQKA